MGTQDQISLPTQQAIDSAERLYNDVRGSFPNLFVHFEARWVAWQDLCQEQTWASFDECIRTNGFKALRELGPKIHPFVVFKLATDPEKNYLGFFLYDEIEFDPDYRVNLQEPFTSKEVLQNHCKQIVELNFQRQNLYKERLALWKAYRDNRPFLAGSAVWNAGGEYLDLVEMGPSIIANIMLEYKEVSFFFDMLHDIIHGHKMRAHMFQPGYLYELWHCFFNSAAPYDIAPKHIPTEVDKHIRDELKPRAEAHIARRPAPQSPAA